MVGDRASLRKGSDQCKTFLQGSPSPTTRWLATAKHPTVASQLIASMTGTFKPIKLWSRRVGHSEAMLHSSNFLLAMPWHGRSHVRASANGDVVAGMSLPQCGVPPVRGPIGLKLALVAENVMSFKVIYISSKYGKQTGHLRMQKANHTGIEVSV